MELALLRWLSGLGDSQPTVRLRGQEGGDPGIRIVAVVVGRRSCRRERRGCREAEVFVSLGLLVFLTSRFFLLDEGKLRWVGSLGLPHIFSLTSGNCTHSR